MRFTFHAPLWRWDARTEDWYFVTVPAELGADIAEIPRMKRGFGAVRVEVSVGSTTWRTSIFPQGEVESVGREYVLPMKKAVRVAEGLKPGALVEVWLTVLDA